VVGRTSLKESPTDLGRLKLADLKQEEVRRVNLLKLAPLKTNR
jgi:hypothetical protein